MKYRFSSGVILIADNSNININVKTIIKAFERSLRRHLKMKRTVKNC